MQIKIPVRKQYTPISKAKVKNHDNINAGEDMEKLDHSYTADENIKWYSYSESLAVSLKIKHAVTIQQLYS